MKTFPERIKHARKSANLTQEELAERVRQQTGESFTQQSLQYLETKAKKSGFTPSIAAITGFSSKWLASGDGPEHTNNKPINYIADRTIPVISWDLVGVDSSDSDISQWITIDGDFSNRTYALNVAGDSMTSPTPPSIPHGSIIVVDPDQHIKHGCLVIAKNMSTNNATFRRYAIEGSTKYLEPLNPRYPVITMDDNYVLCGVVKRAITNL